MTLHGRQSILISAIAIVLFGPAFGCGSSEGELPGASATREPAALGDRGGLAEGGAAAAALVVVAQVGDSLSAALGSAPVAARVAAAARSGSSAAP